VQAIGYVKCADSENAFKHLSNWKLTNGRIYMVYAIGATSGDFLIADNGGAFAWYATDHFAPATKAEYSEWIVDKNEKEKTPTETGLNPCRFGEEDGSDAGGNDLNWCYEHSHRRISGKEYCKNFLRKVKTPA
jgi:hypothetical protein